MPAWDVWEALTPPFHAANKLVPGFPLLLSASHAARAPHLTTDQFIDCETIRIVHCFNRDLTQFLNFQN